MMSTPEAECRKFWARFSIEISDARRDARTADAAVQDRLTAIENFVLRNYSTLWQLHEKRLAPESSPGDLNGSRCEQFNRAAAELAMAFLRWGEALKDSDYVLLNVHDEPVTLAGRYGRCYAEVWHDVVLEQLSLLSDIRPQHSIDMRHCKSGWFYFRGTKRRLPDGMLTVEFEGDCSPADLAAVNTAFAASLDFNFSDQVAAGKLWRHAEGDGSESKGELQKRVALLEQAEKKRTKRLTPTQVTCKQRIKFCCPLRRETPKVPWSKIYSDYIEKFPLDETASPDTLSKSHDRNCLKCLEDKA